MYTVPRTWFFGIKMKLKDFRAKSDKKKYVRPLSQMLKIEVFQILYLKLDKIRFKKIKRPERVSNPGPRDSQVTSLLTALAAIY